MRSGRQNIDIKSTAATRKHVPGLTGRRQGKHRRAIASLLPVELGSLRPKRAGDPRGDPSWRRSAEAKEAARTQNRAAPAFFLIPGVCLSARRPNPHQRRSTVLRAATAPGPAAALSPAGAEVPSPVCSSEWQSAGVEALISWAAGSAQKP